MNREHAVIWCARLARLTWEALKWDSAVPGDATLACTIASIHPLSCNHSPIIFRQHISMWKPPSMMTKCSSPCVSGQHHWTCFAVERLIQSRNGNLCWIKFLYSNTDNIQGMTYHGHGIGVIRKHWQHRKYSWVIFSCLLLFHMVSTPGYVCILCSIGNAVLSIFQPSVIMTSQNVTCVNYHEFLFIALYNMASNKVAKSYVMKKQNYELFFHIEY